jgi:hypothetical protein
MGEMRFLSHEGDSKAIEWDPQDDKSIEVARKKFNEFLAKGYKAFRMDSKGKKTGWPIKDFPVHAANLMLIPMLAGG